LESVSLTSRLLFCIGFFAFSAIAEGVCLAEEPLGSSQLDLHAVIKRAATTHPAIAAAEASARAAGTEVKTAQWQRFPSLSVEGLFLDERGNRIQARAIVDQPLWSGGRINASIERATARKNSALAAHDESLLAIATSTAQAFFELHRWQARIQILLRSQEQHNRMAATMERRYAQEVSPLSDLELARSRALQVEQQLYQARAQESAASNRLRQLAGDPFLAVGPLPEAPMSWGALNDEGVAADVLTFSPLLKRLRFEADTASAEARMARASVLPQLSSQYSYNDISGHHVGFVLKAQSDGGLSRFAAADAAQQRVVARELEITAGERQVRDQIYNLLREYESAVSRLEVSEAARGSAQRVMESYIRQFTSGRRTWLDVMNAMRELTSAEIDTLDTHISAHLSHTQILLLAGKWQLIGAEGTE
jgi:adhesin transport system outer membrane protein